ncbi:MAG: AAA family ATPase [Alphaproteobacteria bacterium]
MQIIAVASQKGGSGKTTLAGHIAVQAERMGGGPVAIVDADPQASLADWWNARAADTPVFAQTSLLRLESDVRRLRNMGIKLLVIDTPPALTSAIRTVVEISDFVVIPTRPSPHDLRSVARTVMIVEELGKPLVFVVNGASSRARITAQAAIALSQHGTLAPAIIHQRADFASSMIDGRTVMEIGRKSPSSVEIADLWEYLDNRLNGSTRTMLPRLHGLVSSLGGD